jgi:prophage tail gpP-like protein
MPVRPPERVLLRDEDGRDFERFESCEVSHEIGQPSKATISFGDERCYREFRQLIKPGKKWTVGHRDKAAVDGRIDVLEASADDGHRLSMTIRTRLSDAFVCGANTKIKVSDTTVSKFFEDLFFDIGYRKERMIYSPSTAVDLMSGKGKNYSKAKVNLEPLQVPQAKVQPGESIMDAATRHLERHGLVLLDLPNDYLGIIRPDLDAKPTYFARSRAGFTRAASASNNITSARRVADWTMVPSTLTVFGATYGGDLAKAPVWGAVVNQEVLDVANSGTGFFRNVITVQNHIRDKDQARAKALREMARLRASQDAWEITLDGAMYWNGDTMTPWLPTGIIVVETDVAQGGPSGDYFIQRVRVRSDDKGNQTTLTCVRTDLLRLS